MALDLHMHSKWGISMVESDQGGWSCLLHAFCSYLDHALLKSDVRRTCNNCCCGHRRVELVAAGTGMSWGLCGSVACSSWGSKGPAALPTNVVDHWAGGRQGL